MRPMHGYEVGGKSIAIQCVDNSNDRCMYISNEPSVPTILSDIELIEVRGQDLELLYNTLHKFLGK